MSYYEDFKAQSIQTPEMMGQLIEQNGGALEIFKVYGLGARSFVMPINVDESYSNITHENLRNEPGKWFEYDNGHNGRTYRTYNSFSDCGITDCPCNKHLTFADRQLAEAYVQAVKNDPIEVERIRQEDADNYLFSTYDYANWGDTEG